jgi:hypothetical protein
MKLACFSLFALVSYVVGQTVLHPAIDINKCLDVRGDVRENGTPVQMYVLPSKSRPVHLTDESILVSIATGLRHSYGI